MSTYILVHGAWHGGWCWQKAASLLEDAGHRVICPDLPGHGEDPTPTRQVTMESYTRTIDSLLARQSEPVILAGHSMAGIVITQAADRRPDKIKTLVFITAHLIHPGESITGNRDKDPDSQTAANLIPNEQEAGVALRPESIAGLFYHDCTEADAKWAVSRLKTHQALAAFTTPAQYSPENFDRVDRVYIECLKDRVITIKRQRQMQADIPCRKVFTLDTSHSPFLSAPAELASALLEVG